jgi:hypothetical protein
MSVQEPANDADLQILDATIVDVLAHLEMLLGHSHSIQRHLLGLRDEVPPHDDKYEHTMPVLLNYADEMSRECAMLAEIVLEFATGVKRLSGQTDTDRRDGLERRSGFERRVEYPVLNA